MIGFYFLLGTLLLLAGYLLYGKLLSRWVGADNERPTPAHEYNDGVDYVPAKTPMLFGHHFSSIAGAGPIVGPILAAIWFGWLPAFLWIIVGAILVGGVHDYTAMMASIRHRGRSVAALCRAYLSPFTYRAFLAFIWFTLVYVLIVFLDLTAKTFAPSPTSETGGTVATASLLYICIALAFGVTIRRFKISFKLTTIIFVPLVFLALYAGSQMPLLGGMLPIFIYDDPKYTWCVILLIYCFVASITPVWILLQPRDYLSSFLLYACLFGGGIGLLFAGVGGEASVTYPGFLDWWKDSEKHTGFIFPLLFITVACGAVSGFHSIVASGTSSKQLPSEKAAKPVAYGGMLVEGILALLAIAAVMLHAENANILNQHPTKIFADGIGTFLATLVPNAINESLNFTPKTVGTQFGLLAISTFLLTTLDTGTRLSRFIFEEFFGLRHKRWRYLSTAASLILPAVIVFMRFPDPQAAGKFIPAWQYIWPVFGATNQLLAALALLVVFAWLGHRKRNRWFVLFPLLFMLASTLTMLVHLIHKNLFTAQKQLVVGGTCMLLLVLAIFVIGDTIKNWEALSPAREEMDK